VFAFLLAFVVHPKSVSNSLFCPFNFVAACDGTASKSVAAHRRSGAGMLERLANAADRKQRIEEGLKIQVSA
jgi:hypothetical protein